MLRISAGLLMYRFKDDPVQMPPTHHDGHHILFDDRQALLRQPLGI